MTALTCACRIILCGVKTLSWNQVSSLKTLRSENMEQKIMKPVNNFKNGAK